MAKENIFKAVAVRYEEEAGAPVLAAKEKGKAAEKLVEYARENDVPVVEDEILGNVLSIPEIGECIPENTWLAVAKIFAGIKKLEEKYSADKRKV